MLDQLALQQPLFMSSKYVKLADLNRCAALCNHHACHQSCLRAPVACDLPRTNGLLRHLGKLQNLVSAGAHLALCSWRRTRRPGNGWPSSACWVVMSTTCMHQCTKHPACSTPLH